MPKFILLVDDNPTIRKFVRTSFERGTSFHVCGEAADGVQAIEKAQVLSPDLIILDLSMPRMSGLEASRHLRRLMPSVPLVLFTLHKDVLRQSDAAKAGITAVVSKTEGMKALLNQVQTLLAPAN